MNTKTIVITGGPGTGKSTCINALKKRNYVCFDEVSRQIILDAQKQGIDQLFLTDPMLFSQKLLEGRAKQFNDAKNHPSDIVFLDRGLPDILAYMDYKGETYPDHFTQACKTNRYAAVFTLAPWQDIYTIDNERYESFDQAEKIHQCLIKTYARFGYEMHDVPFGSVKSRVDFILDTIKI